STSTIACKWKAIFGKALKADFTRWASKFRREAQRPWSSSTPCIAIPRGCLRRDASIKAFVVQFSRDWLALGYSKGDGATSGGPLLARKSLSDMEKREAGARIRTADLLITKAIRTTSEVREVGASSSCDQALCAAPPFSRLRRNGAFFDRQVTPGTTAPR